MSRPALAASRAIDILNFMAARPTQAFSLSELVEHLAVNFASCHAILTVLTKDGFLERHPKHRTYSLGPALVAIGHAALESHPAIDIARDEARDLAQQLDLEVLLTARTGGDLIALARAGRYVAPNAALRVGQRVPMIPPLGAPFMAWTPEAQLRQWLADAPEGASDPAPYQRLLSLVRDRGYAITLQNPVRSQLGEVVANLSDSPHETGLRNRMTSLIGELGLDVYHLAAIDPAQSYEVGMLSAPIFNVHGHAAFTLSLLGFRGQLSADAIQDLADRLMSCCLMVTRKSNGRVPSQNIRQNPATKQSKGGRL
jgi:DNA-binding IclR family transcriptional regulator